MLPQALSHSLQQTRDALRVLGGTPRVLRLVWDAHPGFATLLFATGLTQGLVPLTEMWIFKHIVDVAAEARAIGLGVLLAGGGAVSIADLRFEEVGQDVPATSVPPRQLPREPQNLDLSEN